MKIILIPGMDGTGELFKPLLDELPNNVKTQIICLNNLKTSTPSEQAFEIAPLIGCDEVVILSESYSGNIAYQLSLQSNLNIKHVVFAASFLENPNWLSGFNKLVPLNLVRKGVIPDFVLSFILFNQMNKKLVELFISAIKQVSNSSLRTRLSIITKLEQPIERLQTPCTYIQASNDYLVSKKSVLIFKELCTDINIVVVRGGHFIVQSNPRFFSKLLLSLVGKK